MFGCCAAIRANVAFALLLFVCLAEVQLFSQGLNTNSISSGDGYIVMLHSDGTVWSCGANDLGALGDGTMLASKVPVQAVGLSNIVAVNTGGSHTLALKSDGTVWAFGGGYYGEIGDGNWMEQAIPVQVVDLGADVIDIDASRYNSIALKSDGTVWIWGSDDYGQLGNSEWSSSGVPIQVVGLNDVVDVAMADFHTIALKSDGTVWGFGANDYGQLGTGSLYDQIDTPRQIAGLENVIQIQNNLSETRVLKSDGTVWAFGGNWIGPQIPSGGHHFLEPVQVTGLSNVVELIGGMARKSDGTLWWARADEMGQHIAPEDVTAYYDSVASDSGVGLKSDGSVWGYGTTRAFVYDYSTASAIPVQISSLADVMAAGAGGDHSIALKKNGTVWGFGSDFARGSFLFEQHPMPVQVEGVTGVIAVSAGGDHSLILKGDGTVWSFGTDENGQLGNDEDLVRQKAPVWVSELEDILRISTGGRHSLALKSDGTVWSFGDDNRGQLGNDVELSQKATPVQVSGLTGVVDVAAGANHSLALTSNGTVWSFGADNEGQLGDDTALVQKATPVPVSALTNIVAIAAGGNHSLALDGNGAVWSFGSDGSGQLGNGPGFVRQAMPVRVDGLENVVAIAAGQDFSLALKQDGTLWSFGGNSWGQLGDGTGISRPAPVQVSGSNGIVAITAGNYHAIAVKADGHIEAWGRTDEHQIGEVFGSYIWDDVELPGLNLLHATPEISVTAPASSVSAAIGSGVDVQVSMTGGSGQIGRVKLFHHDVLIEEVDEAPFIVSFRPWTWGEFAITAVVVDTNGSTSRYSEPVTITVPYDSDSDGIPDWWEHKYHDTLEHGASDDVDNDGLTEAGEYFHGTSPADGDSDNDSSSDGAEFASQYGLIPANIAVTDAKANSITLAWQCSYAYETSFLIEKSEDGNTWITAGSAPANATSYAVTGLTEKTAYQFRVTAVSLYGNGKSAAVSGTTKPAKPLSPSQLAVVTSSGAEVTLSWVDGSGNETGFVVEGKEDGASSFQVLATASANATLATVSGLTGTSAYVFRVKSVNSDGTDTESSAASQELSLPALPTPPASLTLLSELWNQCRLEWSLPTDSTRSGVRVFGFDSSGTIERFRINLDKDSEEFTDTGLVAATGYQYQVASVNLRGESVVSLQSVTTGAHVPLPATGLVLTPMGPRSMKVEWTDNANNEASYIVERATTSGASTWLPSPVLPANTVAYLDNVGLQGSGIYYYRVRAVNENGSSVSAEASASTSSYAGANHVPDVLGVLQDLTMNGISAVQTQVPLPYNSGYIEGAKDGEFLFAPKGGGVGLSLYISRVIAPVGSPPVDTLRVEYLTGGGWALAGNLPTPASSSGYGTSVAVSGNRLYVGAPGANDANGVASGMVYVVEFSVNASNQLVVSPPSRLAGVVGEAGDQFGTSVAVDGSRLIVGAPGRDKPSSGGAIVDAGAVQLYDWSGSAWVHNRTEYSPTAMAGDQFGFSVSLRARNYVVGAPYEDLPLTTSYTLQDSGAIYLGRWDSVATLRWLPNLFVLEPAVASKVTGLNQSHFGFSVAIDSYMRVAVGRPDSTWQVSDNMSDWDRGNVMLLQWNGELGDEYVILRRSIVAGGLSAGSRFGEYVEESQGYDFAIRTALRDVSNRPGVFYTVLAMAARPGQLVGSVETSRRVGTAIGLDEDHDPLTFSIPTASNPLSSHFEFGADRVLRAKSTLGTVADGFYTLYATVADDRGGSLTKPLLLYVLGAEDANDADRDGIPDAWELANGLDSNSVFDALSDLDGDGYSALEEYQRFLSGQTSGVDPRSWDLDPDGDIDGDSIVNRLDADPRNPAVGSLGIEITAPVNLQTL